MACLAHTVLGCSSCHSARTLERAQGSMMSRSFRRIRLQPGYRLGKSVKQGSVIGFLNGEVSGRPVVVSALGLASRVSVSPSPGILFNLPLSGSLSCSSSSESRSSDRIKLFKPVECTNSSSSAIDGNESFEKRRQKYWGKLGRVLMAEVDKIDSIKEMVEEEDRITGSLQIGVVGCRRSAAWICFGGGARPRRKRAWKTTNKKGSFAKARKLVDIISELPSAKEEIYGALDAFVAWELEFPLIAIKKGLQMMADVQQWKRVIQVTKWMLSKGQGKTMGTYTLLLQALDYEGRVEEADALWEKLLTEHEDATPRIMFTVVIAMFERHEQPKRLLQVFADMEELEIKPDMVTVERVARTYRSLGLLKRADVVEAKYPATKWGYRYSKRGKVYRIRVNADGQVIKPEIPNMSEVVADVEEEDVEEEDDSDHDTDEFIYEEEPLGEESYFLNSDNALPSTGH